MERVKFPRTWHFPWSLGASSDDKILSSLEYFENKLVVVSEKLDGENTTMYHDYIHARSRDSRHHPSRGMIKAMHAQVQNEIPPNLRICGENMYAKHSIHYKELESYFYVFAAFDERNYCLAWDEVTTWASLLGFPTVPVLYRGPWNEAAVKACWTGISKLGGDQEGYVVRVVDEFPMTDYDKCSAKWVRQGHIQTNEHWMSQEVVPNLLRS